MGEKEKVNVASNPDWSITIPGDIVTYRPPVVTRFGNSYTPAKARDYKSYCRALIAQSAPPELFDGSLAVQIIVTVSRPKSAKKKVYPNTKPDLDNCAKMICDAIQSIVIVNDSRIVDLHLLKIFGDNPGVIIRIWRL